MRTTRGGTRPYSPPAHELVDLQTGEHLERDEVQLVDDYGPYEKGLDD